MTCQCGGEGMVTVIIYGEDCLTTTCQCGGEGMVTVIIYSEDC